MEIDPINKFNKRYKQQLSIKPSDTNIKPVKSSTKTKMNSSSQLKNILPTSSLSANERIEEQILFYLEDKEHGATSSGIEQHLNILCSGFERQKFWAITKSLIERTIITVSGENKERLYKLRTRNPEVYPVKEMNKVKIIPSVPIIKGGVNRASFIESDILEYIRKSPSTTQEIYTALSITYSCANKYLKKLHDSNKIVRLSQMSPWYLRTAPNKEEIKPYVGTTKEESERSKLKIYKSLTGFIIVDGIDEVPHTDSAGKTCVIFKPEQAIQLLNALLEYCPK